MKVARTAVVVLAVASFATAGVALQRGGEGPVGEGPDRGEGATSAPTAYLRRACSLPAPWIRYLSRGWDPGEVRDWDLVLVPQKSNWMGSAAFSHAGPYRYLQEIPLVFYGPGVIDARGDVTLSREVTLADLPSTYAHVMGFDFPRRDGRPIVEVVVDEPRPPRLIVTVVIDGGGWNVLRQWAGRWPQIQNLMTRGASVTGAVVGSSPSTTPPAHTTLATGAFPRRHGVTGLVLRSDGGRITGGFSKRPYDSTPETADPTINLETTTLADEWDLANDNAPLVGMIAAQSFHLGMVGHGRALPGGDRDIVAISAEGDPWSANPRYYSVPDYLKRLPGPESDLLELDRRDGRADGKWRGHEMEPLDATPAYTAWETRALEALIGRGGFGADSVTDLLYVNYKAPDAAGHRWNMLAPEQGDVIGSVDRAVGQIVRLLDHRFGNGEYLLALTADHGQTPKRTRGWGIDQAELRSDLEARFDKSPDAVSIVERTSPALYFVDRHEAEANGVTPEMIASFVSGYTIGENIPAGDPVPASAERRLSERVFAAVIPGRRLDSVKDCAGGRA